MLFSQRVPSGHVLPKPHASLDEAQRVVMLTIKLIYIQRTPSSTALWLAWGSYNVFRVDRLAVSSVFFGFIRQQQTLISFSKWGRR